MGPVICADGSTDSFANAQGESGFQLYCPTDVPDGFTFKGIDVSEAQDAPAGALIARATFVRDNPSGEIRLLQGRPGLSALADIVRGKALQDTIAYSDTPANLLEDTVLARSSEGYTQIITTTGISTDELLRVSAGMQRVPGPGPSPTVSPAAP